MKKHPKISHTAAKKTANALVKNTRVGIVPQIMA
jgi:hypothetical protein